MSKRFIIVTVHKRSLILVFFPFSPQNKLSLLPKKPIYKQIVWNHDKTVRFFFKNVNDRFAKWLHFSNTLNLSVDTSNEEPHLLVFSITRKQSFPLSVILRPHFITLKNLWLCSVLTTGYKTGTYRPIWLMISYSQSTNIKLYFEVLIFELIEWMIFWMKYLWYWMTL